VPELEAVLSGLGAELYFPPTPDLRQAVRRRLAPAPRPWWQSRWALAAAAALLLAAAAVLAIPQARDTVAGWLGLRGVTIQRQPGPLPTPTPRPPGPLGERLQLGDRVTLAEARATVRWRLRLPFQLDEPDEVYYSNRPAGGGVYLVYGSRPGIPVASETGVAVLVGEFQGRADQNLFLKGVGPGTTVEQVTVNGLPGIWVSGAPHQFFYTDPDGRVQMETLRLATNTLLWTSQDGVLYRIEASVTKQQALAIAESMR